MTMIYMIDGIPQYLTVNKKNDDQPAGVRFSSWQKLRVLPMEIRSNCEMKMGRYVMITFMKV